MVSRPTTCRCAERCRRASGTGRITPDTASCSPARRRPTSNAATPSAHASTCRPSTRTIAFTPPRAGAGSSSNVTQPVKRWARSDRAPSSARADNDDASRPPATITRPARRQPSPSSTKAAPTTGWMAAAATAPSTVTTASRYTARSLISSPPAAVRRCGRSRVNLLQRHALAVICASAGTSAGSRRMASASAKVSGLAK